MGPTSTPGNVERARTDHGPRLRLSGDWTLPHAARLEAAVARLGPAAAAEEPDVSALGRLDTAGAVLLVELLGRARAERLARDPDALPAAPRALLDAVVRAAGTGAAPAPRRAGVLDLLALLGEHIEAAVRNGVALLGFLGLLLATLARGAWRPRRWRVTSLVFHIQQTGLDAVPIVALLSFLVGAVIAFLGVSVLRTFGASIFTVELVGYSFLREFGVLLTAILVAGRSGSAFTAQIGSMKSREEVDAIRMLGLDPVEVLVLPRLLALLVALPLLTFLAMIAGIVGGGVVSALVLGISPEMFVTRFHETTTVRHFLVGMSKAPVFAWIIALTGCLEGMRVKGSAESVGERTTASVVRSIFLVIVVDALAAILFTELNV